MMSTHISQWMMSVTDKTIDSHTDVLCEELIQ